MFRIVLDHHYLQTYQVSRRYNHFQLCLTFYVFYVPSLRGYLAQLCSHNVRNGKMILVTPIRQPCESYPETEDIEPRCMKDHSRQHYNMSYVKK